MRKQKVLFVCIHNSARSQMAEALLNHLAGDRFEAESAGLEPGILNPLAVDAMRALNIDISHKKTKSAFDMFKQGRIFQYVIAVCDEASERCPIFPSAIKRLSWSFADPAALQGSFEEKLTQTIVVRDQISKQIETWLTEL
ncbi:MAG: arsenate reductase ArsC [Bacteroidota bacterium]